MPRGSSSPVLAPTATSARDAGRAVGVHDDDGQVVALHGRRHPLEPVTTGGCHPEALDRRSGRPLVARRSLVLGPERIHVEVGDLVVGGAGQVAVDVGLVGDADEHRPAGGPVASTKAVSPPRPGTHAGLVAVGPEVEVRATSWRTRRS